MIFYCANDIEYFMRQHSDVAIWTASTILQCNKRSYEVDLGFFKANFFLVCNLYRNNVHDPDSKQVHK